MKAHPLVVMLLLCAGLGAAATTTSMVFWHTNEVPLLDHWDIILGWAAGTGGFDARQLWAPHNEHRIVVPRLFYLMDLTIGQGRMSLLFLSILLLHLATAGIWTAFARTLGDLSRSATVALFGLALLCSFSIGQIETFLWAFQVCFSLLVFFSTLSLGSFGMHCRAVSRSSSARQRAWLCACIAAALLASLTLASGIALWPVLIVASVTLRLPRSTVIWLTLTGLVVIGVYLYELRSPSPGMSLAEVVGRGVPLAKYVLLYLGAPAAAVGQTFGFSAGLVGLAAAGLVVVATLRRRWASDLGVLVATCVGFWIACATLTALGRVSLGVDQALSSRYQTFVLQFWLALGTAGFAWFSRHERHRLQAHLFLLAAGAVSAAAYLNAWISLEPHFVRAAAFNEAASAMGSGFGDHPALRLSYPTPNVPRTGMRYLRAHRLSVYAGASAAAVARSVQLTNLADPLAGASCRGGVDAITRVDWIGGYGFRLQGWAWDAESDGPLARFAVADQTGRVVGTGRSTAASPRWTRFGLSTRRSVWVAYAPQQPSLRSLTVHGATRRGTCTIATVDVGPLSPHTTLPSALKERWMHGAIFRHGQWFYDLNHDYVCTEADDRVRSFGEAGDAPVAGDWDGTGRVRVGIFRKGRWLVDLNGSGTWDGKGVDGEFIFGQDGDIPVVGDWDDSGALRAGVFREGEWRLDLNGNGLWDGPTVDALVAFGRSGDHPVVGDWDYSGHLRIGVFRDGLWTVDFDGDFHAGPEDKTFIFGERGDIPLSSDWTGAGALRVGVFRGGTWYADLNGNHEWDVGDDIALFGQAGDLPIVGPW